MQCDADFVGVVPHLVGDDPLQVLSCSRAVPAAQQPRYALYRRRFLCRFAFMRLRRLCLAIFALRFFLSEPIQIFRFASSDSTIRWAAMQLSSRCNQFLNIESRFALHSLQAFHSGNLSPFPAW